MFRGIRLSTLLALLVLAGTVPLAIFAGLLIRSGAEHQTDTIDRRNLETARAISVAVDLRIESTIEALEAVVSQGALDSSSSDDLAGTMRSLLLSRPQWTSTFVLDRDGGVTQATWNGSPPVLPIADVAREVTRSKAPYISALTPSTAGRGFSFIVGVPEIRDDVVARVFSAEVNVSTLSAILRRQDPGPSGIIAISDRNFAIMARSRGEAEFVGGKGSDEFIEATRGRSSGSWRGTTLEGNPSYSSFSRSALTGWVVGVGVLASEVDGPVQRSFRALTVAGVAILLLGAGLAAAVGRSIVRATQGAADTARRLARGEPIDPIRSPIAEIDVLSSGLEQAGAILRARQKERDEAERQRQAAAGALESALFAEKASRLASEAHELHLDVTLQSIGDAVIATDSSGHVTIVNAVAQALTGWPIEEALGRPLFEVFRLVDEKTRQPIATPSVEELCAPSTTTLTLPVGALLVARNGREIPVEDSIAPIRSADGSSLGCVLVFRDVTERREDERRRVELFEREQEARRQAEALSRSKDDFVATMSHELRTPLNAIFGWVRLLRSGALGDSDRERALEVIERNTRAQTQLVEDLLDMSRIITGRLRPEMRRIDPAPVVRAAIDAVRPTALNKGVEITSSFADHVAFVAGDPDRLQQVVWNLLVNAIRFTPKGGTVFVMMVEENSEVVVTVRDTGAGIAPHVLPYLFDHFWQGPSPAGQVSGGLGIGLSLVRRIVDLHAGTVTAESAGLGQGATFTVRLPIFGNRTDPVAVSESRAKTAEPELSHAEVLSGVHALVVDDDEDSRDLVATTLRQAGANVEKAASVAEALERLEAHRPDVVLSDIAMPDATGYELVSQIRGHAGYGRLPIIALTAYSRLEDRSRALNAGFTYYIGKPVEPSTLVRTVASAVGRDDGKHHG